MNHLKLENCPNCGGKITLYSHTSLADSYECFARCSECKTEYPMPEVHFATHGIWIYPSSIKKAERIWNERAVSMCKLEQEANAND